MSAFAGISLTRRLALMLSVLLAFESVAYAQYDGAPPPPPNAQIQAQPAFSQQELDQMLAPIALYPDPLLSQILMAATYPLEVVEAARWSRANPNLLGDEAVRAVQQRHWDPSVISLVAFPQVLQMMDNKLDWTERLGDAFLAQEPQVMDTVQSLRHRAYAAGNLRSNDQIQVQSDGSDVLVEPANPEIVYVPYYDPSVVYGSWWWPGYPPIYWDPWPGYYMGPGFAPGFAWDIGIAITAGFFFGEFDWHHRHLNVGNINNYYFHGYKNNGGNTPPGLWHHDPTHRRGVPYRAESLRQQYGAASASHEARRNFRGYDQSSTGNHNAPPSRPNEVGNPSTMPNHSNPDPVINHETRSFTNPANPGITRAPQIRPSAPAVVNRPVPEVRPHAFEDIERGADVQLHSSRGRASFEGSARTESNIPSQRPSGNAPSGEFSYSRGKK